MVAEPGLLGFPRGLYHQSIATLPATVDYLLYVSYEEQLTLAQSISTWSGVLLPKTSTTQLG